MKKHISFRPFPTYFILFLFIVLLFTNACNNERRQRIGYVTVIKKALRTPGDIVPVKIPRVVPYVYTRTCSLDTLPVPEKKKKFLSMMLPAILVAKTNLDSTRSEVEKMASRKKLTGAEKARLKRLMKRFGAGDVQELSKRLHTFPVSIALAQAAIESGWGTSRFFLQANNPFGIWSFDPKHNRLAARSTRDGTKVYLRKYKDLEQAIEHYFLILATGRPFAAFREARMKTDNPDTLIQTLKMYSERREAYVDDLARVIRVNRLKRFDKTEIDPSFIHKRNTRKLFPE